MVVWGIVCCGVAAVLAGMVYLGLYNTCDNHRPPDQEARARAGRAAQAGGERGAQLGHGALDRQHGAADGPTAS
jgi:hypothetical protein